MASGASLTLIGNLTGSPKSGFTQSGVAWANLRLAVNSRVFDPATKEWRDGKTMYVDVSCWRRLAENVSECLDRGDPVVVSGKLQSRSWIDSNGNRRETFEMEADAVGVDLSKRKAKVVRPLSSVQPVEPVADPEPVDWSQPGEPAFGAPNEPVEAVREPAFSAAEV